MLESEFSLRLVILSEVWSAALLGDISTQKLAIEALKSYMLHPKKGMNAIQKKSIIQKQTSISDNLRISPGVADLASLTAFWEANQNRSTTYEPILKKYFDYNLGLFSGFSKRPDLVIESYSLCSVGSSMKDSASDINKVIERKCHVVEFTAQKDAQPKSVKNYLREKLQQVYIELPKEN